ncbi:MAG TPA: hypothetical protein DCE13_04870, partial [Cryomorphaceae bacterium]|nr:hypothetical protein [Cryomorphaceae bacterium]
MSKKGGVQKESLGRVDAGIASLNCYNNTKNSEIAVHMWQRIQTLYMALGAMMFFLVGTGNPSNAQALLAGLGVALFLANTTYFKHRKRQFVVNRVVILTAFVLEGWMLYSANGFSAGKEQEGSPLEFLAMAAPLMAVIFAALANRAIQSD